MTVINTKVHTIEKWADAHGTNRSTILRWTGPFACFSIRSHENKGKAHLPILNLGTALKLFIRPTFDRLIGPKAVQKAFRGSINFLKPDPNSPPYTLNRGHNLPPQIHINWTGTPQDLIWLTHEVAHATQIQLSNHGEMQPIARETCAFIGELALIKYVTEVDPNLGRELQAVWRQQSAIYLGENFALLKSALHNQNAPYSYVMNYPLARLASVFLSSRLLPSQALNLFRSGPSGMECIAMGKVISHYEKIYEDLGPKLSSSALIEVMLEQVDFERFSHAAKLGAVNQYEAIHPIDVVPGRCMKWRSLGIMAVSALRRNDANLKPAEMIKLFIENERYSKSSTNSKKECFDGFSAIGMAIHHLAQSPYHQNFDLSYYLPVEILPALFADQLYCFVDDEGTPTGLVTWAWLSDDVKDDLRKSGRALNLNEWNGGSHLFFNDWITEPRSFRKIMHNFTTNVFPNSTAISFRRNPDGSIRKVCRWVGKNVEAHKKTVIHQSGAYGVG